MNQNETSKNVSSLKKEREFRDRLLKERSSAAQTEKIAAEKKAKEKLKAEKKSKSRVLGDKKLETGASKKIRKKRFEERINLIATGILEHLVLSKHYTAKEIAKMLTIDFSKGSIDRNALSEALQILINEGLLEKKGRHFFKEPEKKSFDKDVVVGVVEKKDGRAVLLPVNEDVEPISLGKVSVPGGHIVTVRPVNDFNEKAVIIKDHGAFEKEQDVCRMVALDNGIPIEFPAEVLEEVRTMKVPEVGLGILDMRNEPFVTIDPDTAKDFDDAVLVRKKGEYFIVKVAVADVSYYVKPGTAVHAEALKRGNSTYLPGYTIPMLPEKLSNDLCSLKPDEDRLAMVATLKIDKYGSIRSKQFDRALIQSTARLNYGEVMEAIKGGAGKKVASVFNRYLVDVRQSFGILRAERDARGALDLNTVEQRSDYSSEGVSISAEKGDEAHGMIEEHMILANRAVIEQLDEDEKPLIARVHGKPFEKLFDEQVIYLEKLGATVNKDLPIEDRVRDVAAQANGHKNGDRIRRILIRVQDRARYEVGVKPHYGLALEKYGHFTSPIRRFSDLINHDLLMQSGNDLYPFYDEQNLKQVVQHINMTEQRSEDVERECKKRLNALWMKGNLGKTFNAKVMAQGEEALSVFVSEQGEKRRIRITADIRVPDSSKYKTGQIIQITPSKANVITGMIEFQMAKSNSNQNSTDYIIRSDDSEKLENGKYKKPRKRAMRAQVPVHG